MKYMGSKNRIAKHILPIMLDEMKKRNITTWAEPFVGGGNMIDKVPSYYTRIGYDLNPHVIQAMIGVRDFVNELPTEVSEEYYKSLKGTEPNPITSWIRFVCAFAGIFENGYAREKGSDETTFCGYGKRNAIKQSQNIQGIGFICDNFKNLVFDNSLIYCDPPYRGTTKYKTEGFPYELFYDWCREMKKRGNIVFVSEYNMPSDFKEVWKGEIKTNFASSRKTATHNAIEKLFIL